jgi:hypothetical protein
VVAGERTLAPVAAARHPGSLRICRRRKLAGVPPGHPQTSQKMSLVVPRREVQRPRTDLRLKTRVMPSVG